MWQYTRAATACSAVAFLILALALLSGCASPAHKYDQLAASEDLSSILYQGPRFHHRIYRNAAMVRDATLRVFIEGDVAVNVALGRTPPDPAPRRALMLRLLHLQPDAAILLGRPCYHGAFAMDGCEIRHLGGERYSAEIIESMIGALRSELHAGVKRVVFFGYSGGGTIALLMAARMPETAAVVTLSGNLDNTALSTYHGAPALSGSLDPADLPPLPRNVVQLHFFGEQDDNIPASLARKTLQRQNVRAVMIPGIDHDCCWEENWPGILTRLQQAMAEH